mgnify:FL=1
MATLKAIEHAFMNSSPVCYIWPRSAVWLNDRPESIVDRIRHSLIGELFPESFCGALEIEQGEGELLYRIGLAYIIFSFTVGEDLFIVPGSGRVAIVCINHDQVAVASCFDESAARAAAAILEGHDLEVDMWSGDWGTLC